MYDFHVSLCLQVQIYTNLLTNLRFVLVSVRLQIKASIAWYANQRITRTKGTKENLVTFFHLWCNTKGVCDCP